MLDGFTVYNGNLELIDNGLVDLITLEEKQLVKLRRSADPSLTKSSTVQALERSTTGAV